MADDLAKMDATAQAELVRSGAVSPRELVDAAIERVEKFNPQGAQSGAIHGSSQHVSGR